MLANHRWAAHEIARTVGLDTAPYAGGRPGRAAPGRPPGVRAARAGHRRARWSAGRWPSTAARDPGLELFAAELAFFRDGDAFLVDGGTEVLTGLAERLAAVGDRSGAARAWTRLATAAWSRAAAPRRALPGPGDRDLWRAAGQSEEKAEALLELARVHMLNAETDPACAAASAAAELAERLLLPEVQANARITLAVARYMAGERWRTRSWPRWPNTAGWTG